MMCGWFSRTAFALIVELFPECGLDTPYLAPLSRQSASGWRCWGTFPGVGVTESVHSCRLEWSGAVSTDNVIQDRGVGSRLQQILARHAYGGLVSTGYVRCGGDWAVVPA